MNCCGCLEGVAGRDGGSDGGCDIRGGAKLLELW